MTYAFLPNKHFNHFSDIGIIAKKSVFKMLTAKLLQQIIFVFPFIITNKSVLDQFKIVETNSGAVRGSLNTTIWKNVHYYSFKGIPYAEKPIGELRRFKVKSILN